MNYEILVTRKGRHIFATDPRSLPAKFSVRELLPVLRRKFPVLEGYHIEVVESVTTSTSLTAAEWLRRNGKVPS